MKKIIIPAIIGAGTLVFLLSKKQEISNHAQKLIAPLKGRVSSPYGFRSSGFHNGTDIAVPIGTPIKSPADGKILGTYTNERGGLQLLVWHDNGFISGYAHLSKVFLLKNTLVKQGEIIALSGNTGISTGPHLHFTLKKHDNSLLNPENYIIFAS